VTIEPPNPRLTIGGGLVILLLAVGLHLVAASLHWSDTQSDPDAYVGLARNIAAGHGYCTPGSTQPTAYRPPIYPILLAAGLLTVGWWDGGLIVVLNIGCHLLTICTVGWFLSRRSTSSGTPLIGMFLLAFDPLAIRYTVLPMTELCFTALSTISTLGLIDLWERSRSTEKSPGLWWWGVVGVLCGLTALCRPSIWPFWGVIGVFLIVRAVSSRCTRETCVAAVLWCGLLGLTVLPWVIRNQWVMGSPLLTTTHGGYTLWLANNPTFYDEVARQPWGTVWSHDSLATWQNDSLRRMDAEIGTDAGEVAQDRWFKVQARQAIAHDPAGFVWAVCYRVRSFWSLSPRGPERVQGWLSTAVSAWYFTLFAAATYGGWQQRRRGAAVTLLLLSIVVLQGVHCFYWTDTRMRLPIHPWLAIFAAWGIAGLLRQRSRS